MKKFNKNILVFVICMLFVGVGLCSGDLFSGTKDAFDNLMNGKSSKFTRIAKFEKIIDSISTDNLLYHNEMMDVNSIKDNALGTRVVIKDDTTVVKSDNSSLITPLEMIDDEEIDTIATNIDRLRTVSETNEAKFLYCFAPTKHAIESAPDNTKNSYYTNVKRFFRKLDNYQIPYIDLSNAFNNEGGLNGDCFYKTDHHWTVHSGFLANSYICNQLNDMFGFDVNKEYTDLQNYKSKTYKDWFLGSYGKKVGTFFTWSGADDFELITPKFDTSLTEEQPFKNEKKRGSFENTVLYKDNLNKGYYDMNTYATYCGGDFRLQIIKNNLNQNGKKVLMIRDSFAGVVAPFLAFQTSELHISDMRDFTSFAGKKINAEEYINKISPDYVIVLYSGISSLNDSDGKYDFF